MTTPREALSFLNVTRLDETTFSTGIPHLSVGARLKKLGWSSEDGEYWTHPGTKQKLRVKFGGTVEVVDGASPAASVRVEDMGDVAPLFHVTLDEDEWDCGIVGGLVIEGDGAVPLMTDSVSMLDEAAIPGVLSHYGHRGQIVDFGQHGRFRGVSVLTDKKNASKTIHTVAEYKAGVKAGTLQPDDVVDKFDIPLFLKKVSKALDQLHVPKKKGVCIFADYKSSGPSKSPSGWSFNADAGGSVAITNLNHSSSPVATGKFKAWKAPRSPHTLVHEYCHQIWPLLNKGQQYLINKYFNLYVSGNETAACAAQVLPNLDSNGKEKPQEWYCEIVAYSIYGTARVQKPVRDFLLALMAVTGEKDAEAFTLKFNMKPNPDSVKLLQGQGKTVPAYKEPTGLKPDKKPKAEPMPLSVPATAIPSGKGSSSVSAPTQADGGIAIAALVKQGLIEPAPTSSSSKHWQAVWQAVGGVGKKWRDKVRATLTKLKAKAEGTWSGGPGTPSMFTLGQRLFFVNHAQGIALAAPGVTLSTLREALEDARAAEGTPDRPPGLLEAYGGTAGHIDA